MDSFLQTVLDILNWLGTNIPWEALAASGLLTVFLQVPKQWVKRLYKHYDWVMLALAFVGSLWLVTLEYLQDNPTIAPQLLVVHAAAMAYMTQPFYKLMVKPISTKFVSFLSAQVAEAKRRSAAQAATEPSTGLPLTASPVEQFSE